MTSGLNSPQRAAVNYIDGPCLVLAGAGSGKTRVITQKIAHLIQSCGYEAKNIAALTFTNKAALEMRERVAKLLSEPGHAKQLTVSTFHSLGVHILRREAASLKLKERFSIMDSDDCYSVIQDLAATTDKALIRKLQQAISLWKNALLTPEQALNIAKDENEAQAARFEQCADEIVATILPTLPETRRLALSVGQKAAIVKWWSEKEETATDPKAPTPTPTP